MNSLIRGALGGLAGTLAMTASMAVARLGGHQGGELPPRKISRRVEKAIGLYGQTSQVEFEASWLAQHLAYGMGAGIAFATADSKFKLPPPVVSGPIFGLSLWAISYAGWLPAVGLYPPPTQDRSDRIAGMIVHHLVFGTTTAYVTRALQPARDSLREEALSLAGKG